MVKVAVTLTLKGTAKGYMTAVAEYSHSHKVYSHSHGGIVTATWGIVTATGGIVIVLDVGMEGTPRAGMEDCRL